ncbi:MAG: hypothetical protein JXQ73_01195 [Phycisphaerae bacterium]|nr:hypothetical protein [Phycisphaerae bacterium]
MTEEIRQTVTIQSGGRVEVMSKDLPEGRQAEVIVRVKDETAPKSYLELFGAGTGAFANPQVVDRFLRRERDAWEA